MTISPSFFDVMRIPLVAGRDFTEHDDDHVAPVAIISRRLAAKLWPNESAIGKSLAWPSSRVRRPPLEIVGVVGDTRHASLSEPPSMVVYRPYAQVYDINRTLVLRGRGIVAPSPTTPRRLALAVDPRVEIVGNTWADRAGTTVEQHLEGVIEPQRVATAWVGAFGLVALVLAGIGLYGVVAQTVLLRTRELAVRSALGATPAGLLALVVRDGMRLAIGGAAIGAVVSLSGIGVLRGLVASVEVADARAAVIAVVALAMVMLAASYLPARSVARLNPIDALRCD
jgi:hypothetical protein